MMSQQNTSTTVEGVSSKVGKGNSLEDSDVDSVQMLDSRPQTATTAAHTVMVEQSMAGLPNFHPPGQGQEDLHDEAVGTHLTRDSAVDAFSKDDNSEEAKSQPKKKKRNKKKKKGAKDDITNNGDAEDDSHNWMKEMPGFPLKDHIADSFFEDQDSSEDEGMPDYKIGGYHPVHVGEILLDRYVIIQKLGWGHFSTVWLTKDLKHNSYVAIKVQKSAQHYLEAAYDEVEILDKVASNWRSGEWKHSVDEYYKKDPELMKALKKYGMSGDTSHCVQLLNSFIHSGPNGKHFVMVFEILGVNFLEIIKRYDYRGVPIPLVRKLARQCLIGLDYIHRQCKIIHTDFKPENVVIGLRDDEVSEIKKTGQLTTTKMFQGADYLRKLNMKVAGTLQQTSVPPVDKSKSARTGLETDKQQSLTSTATKNTQDLSQPNPMFEGLTAKQKKNLKKKMKRKQKKLEESQMTSTVGGGSQQDETDTCEENGLIDMDSVQVLQGNTDQIVAQGKEFFKQKKKAITDSLDRFGGGPTKVDDFDGLLGETDPLKNGEAAESQNDKNGVETSKRGPRINEDVQVKICDMGNGCWTYHHFTPEIQTRQYRSPEVIIGADYTTSADVWSFACTIFEMVTGDFLFEPRKGQNYDKDDDHLAQMMELLGKMPKNLALAGKHSRKFFNSKGNLRNISGLNFWPIHKVLTQKYLIKEKEALALADFLMPMLGWHHDRRATAEQMLKHPWLDMEANYDTRYTKKEFDIQQLKKEMKNKDPADDLMVDDPRQEMNELAESEPELYAADSDESGSLSGPGINEDLSDEGYGNSRSRRVENLYGSIEGEKASDDRSLMRSRSRRARLLSQKAKLAKINNSFTGPYPLDPTEFNHNDKGANVQFAHGEK